MDKFEFGNKNAPIVLLQAVDDHDLACMENEAAYIKEFSGRDFFLAAFKVDDWFSDLSPWKAPAVFGNDDFGDGAPRTLSAILKECEDPGRTYYIGGYSLAGLFALWAAYQTDIFAGISAASPSMWFKDFDVYMKDNKIKTDRVYLSLGDREERTANAVMRTVGDRIRAAHDLLVSSGIECTLEWNKGNHFKEPDLRTAKAFAWVMGDNDVS